MENPNEVKPTSIRIKNSLRDKIKRKAKEEGRSFNNMVERILEKATGIREGEHASNVLTGKLPLWYGRSDHPAIERQHCRDAGGCKGSDGAQGQNFALCQRRGKAGADRRL